MAFPRLGPLENAVGTLWIITQFKSYIRTCISVDHVDAGCLQHVEGGELEEQTQWGTWSTRDPLAGVIKTSSNTRELGYRGQHDVMF